MNIEFYGGSDDIIAIRVNGRNKHEVGGYISGGDGYYSKALEVRSIGGARGVRVHAIYDGCWSFAVGLLEEGRSLPPGWKLAIDQEHPYSTRLAIDTDDELVEITREGGAPLVEGA